MTGIQPESSKTKIKMKIKISVHKIYLPSVLQSLRGHVYVCNKKQRNSEQFTCVDISYHKTGSNWKT